MRPSSLVLAVLGLAACGGPSSGPIGVPTASDQGDPAKANRCGLGDPVVVSRGPFRASPWMVRGPEGFRLVGSWDQPERVGLTMSSGEGLLDRRVATGGVNTLAWTGEHYLALVGNSLRRYDPELLQASEVHAGPEARACEATLAEGAGRVLAVWGRSAAGGRCSASVPWVQAFGANGVPVAAPMELPLPEGVATAQTRWLRARWDFGRFVVTAELAAGGVWSWVLDPEGRVLGGGRDLIACPRVGCVRITTGAEVAREEVDTTAQVIRVESVGRGGFAPFTLPTTAREVRGVAVSGDRMLLLHDTPSRFGCGLTLVDVALRAVITQAEDEKFSCTEGSLRPRPRGFVYAVYDPVQGAATRTLDCTD